MLDKLWGDLSQLIMTVKPIPKLIACLLTSPTSCAEALYKTVNPKAFRIKKDKAKGQYGVVAT
jgi:hypothetical protein